MPDHDTHDHTGVPGVGTPADILDIPTAEMDDTLVLAPDGAGGVEFRAEAGGGGSGMSAVVDNDVAGTTFSTGSTSFTDLTGISITKSTGAHRCIVSFIGNVSNDTVGAWTAVTLLIDGTNQAAGTSIGWMAIGTSRGANDIYPVSFTFLTGVLSAASHTFKIQMRVSGGTGKIREEGLYGLTVIETDMAS